MVPLCEEQKQEKLIHAGRILHGKDWKRSMSGASGLDGNVLS